MKLRVLFIAGMLIVLAGIVSASGYDLSDYPEMFIEGDDFDAVIVVGDHAPSSDVVGAIDIAASLQSIKEKIKDILEQGQSKTYTVDGKDYEVEVVWIGGTPSQVKFMVNGELTDLMEEGDSYILADGALIGVKEILEDEAGEVTCDMVEFYLESSEFLELNIAPARLASEIGDVSAQNLITVGNPCHNSITDEFIECEDWSLEEGMAIIKLFENGDRLALVVAGTTELDTRRAAKVLANYEDYSLSGDEFLVTGTSLDEITVSFPSEEDSVLIEEDIGELEYIGDFEVGAFCGIVDKGDCTLYTTEYIYPLGGVDDIIVMVETHSEEFTNSEAIEGIMDMLYDDDVAFDGENFEGNNIYVFLLEGSEEGPADFAISWYSGTNVIAITIDDWYPSEVDGDIFGELIGAYLEKYPSDLEFEEEVVEEPVEEEIEEEVEEEEPVEEEEELEEVCEDCILMDSIQEGKIKICTVNGKDYEVENVYIDDDKVRLEVNGEDTGLLEEGDLYTLADGMEIVIIEFIGDRVEFGFIVEEGPVEEEEELEEVCEDCILTDVREEGEIVTYTINDKDYEVEIAYLDDEEVKFKINGEVTDWLEEGDSYISSSGIGIIVIKITDDEVVEFGFIAEDGPVEEIRSQISEIINSGPGIETVDRGELCIAVPYGDEEYYFDVEIDDGEAFVKHVKNFCGPEKDFVILFKSYDKFKYLVAHPSIKNIVSGHSGKYYYFGISRFVKPKQFILDNKFKSRYCGIIAANTNKIGLALLGLSDCSEYTDVITDSKFDGETTDFSEIGDLSKAKDVVLEKVDYGKIDFGDEELDLRSTYGLESYIGIGKGKISIDTGALPAFKGKGAVLTMYGLDFKEPPRILRNGKPCGKVCSDIHYDAAEGVLRFRVKHFTTYEVVEGMRKEKMQISKIKILDEYVKPGEEVMLNVGLEAEEFEDVKITVVIPELGLKRQLGPFDLDDGESRSLLLEIPKGTRPGEYDVRITISNDEVRRVKHRVIIVE